MRLDNPDITLDPAAIASLDEETGADLIVEATRAGQTFVTSTTPMRVLAARQWLVDPDAPVPVSYTHLDVYKRQGGGTIHHGPAEVPGGAWIALATDPQGAWFAVVGPR